MVRRSTHAWERIHTYSILRLTFWTAHTLTHTTESAFVEHEKETASRRSRFDYTQALWHKKLLTVGHAAACSWDRDSGLRTTSFASTTHHSAYVPLLPLMSLSMVCLPNTGSPAL